jgi:acyl transferase domain-containing protein
MVKDDIWQREPSGMEVAIVGLAGRFPGARDLGEYWENLRRGIESIHYLTDQELDALGVPTAVYRQPGYVRAVRSIADVDLFDAGFFDISPREAEVMDPQHRLFLELAWEALEDAGYDPDRHGRGIGVFAGSRMNSYLLHVLGSALEAMSIQAQVSNDKDYLATRVSYKLNLGGPSLAVQTACSTSLVALHLACQSLLAGECDMALAGGCSIRTIEIGYPFREGDVGSPDGRIHAFDASAQGTIFGNGCGVVLLKRLSEALADGDAVRAVILGTGVTNDGSRKVGFTAPSVDGQARAIRAALTVADVHPESVSYIEAHGTGTSLGDPIEIEALTQVYREHTERTQYCLLGSVKSNIGHLSSAAGVASLAKVVLALEHGELPPSINYQNPNPQIDFPATPFRVVTEPTPWQSNGAPRRAGVSAFGMGGTNAHAILEEAPPREPSSPSRPWQQLWLSARTETALDELTGRLAAHLGTHRSLPLADVAFTLEEGRRRHRVRRAVVAASTAEAAELLAALPRERATTGRAEAGAAVAFLFPGQGAQHPGMGRELYEGEEVFRRQVDRAAEVLAPALGFDLRQALYPAPGDEEAAAERLTQTAVTQPALFVVEHALAQLLLSWGLSPKAMIGHSIGEYVAACLAGVFSLEQALALVAERGRLMQSLPAGSMLSVPLAEEDLPPLLTPELSIAALNAPGRAVVSGPAEAVAELARRLEERGTPGRPLKTSHAFHSPMMEPILTPFVERFRGLSLGEPRVPFVSNLTGTWITAEQATDPAYWAQHLRRAVRFADGVATLAADPSLAFLEVGPGRTLATLARQHPQGKGRVIAATLPHPKDRATLPEAAALERALAELWVHGVGIDAPRRRAGERRHRVPLPTYPFERRRYWVDLGRNLDGAGSGPPRKLPDLASWFYLPVWKPQAPAPQPADDQLVGTRWLLFLDDTGVGEALAKGLTGAGATVITVRPGERFEALGGGGYRLAPGEREGYGELVAALGEELPERILHLWSVTGGGTAAAEQLERGFWSLLWLGQALGRGAAGRDLTLLVAADRLVRVRDERELEPAKAAILGPVQVLPREHPEIRTLALDLDPGEDAAQNARALLAEALAVPAEPALKALRRDPVTGARVRHERAVEASPLPPAGESELRLVRGGTYLVTGGLGGLGRTFARYLAERWGANLVLTSRSPLPPREDWPRVLADGGAAAERVREVERLEATGGQVLVGAADVTDREAMGRVLAAARERFGRIHGVIHAAGLPGGGVIQRKTREAAQAVLAPKIFGTLMLADLLAEHQGETPPDWWLLCSSTIAVLGGAGQVDYCAANNFLDAWAHAHAASGVVSVNWGAWEEVGMAVAAGMMPGRGGYGAASAAPQPGDTAPLAGEPTGHPLLGHLERVPGGSARFRNRLSPEAHWVLDEHRIAGTPALPGTSHVEIAAAACRALTGAAAVRLTDVFFFSPLLVEPGGGRLLEAELTADGDGFRFLVKSHGAGGAPQDHARGRVSPVTAEPAGGADPAAIAARLEPQPAPSPDDIAGSAKLVSWGAHWQSLRQVWLGEGEGLALLELPAEFAAEVADYVLHPALLDVATGIASALFTESFLPLSYGRITVHGPLPARFYSHLRRAGEAGARETVSVDLTLLAEDGRALVAIERFSMKRVGAAAARLTAAPKEVEVVAASDGILPAEGVDALRRILARTVGFPQVAVSAKSLPALAKLVAEAAKSRGAAREERPTHARPELTTAYEAPASDLEKTLAGIWQRHLGIDRVGVRDNFFDLGGDSVIGIQIVSSAQEAGLRLAPDQLFEYQTVAELARALGGAAATPAATAETPPMEADGGLSEDELAKVMAQLGGMES